MIITGKTKNNGPRTNNINDNVARENSSIVNCSSTICSFRCSPYLSIKPSLFMNCKKSRCASSIGVKTISMYRTTGTMTIVKNIAKNTTSSTQFWYS